MLILTRKIDQGLRIFDSSGLYIGRIVIIGVEHDRVKIGMDVDERFTILRDELIKDAGKNEPLGS